MGKVLLCVGKYAKTPYFVEKSYHNVYSAEELCYCLMQNVYLVDREIMDSRLADWLEQECELKELAEELRTLLKEECRISDFVGAILDYVGYAGREEAEQVKLGLQNGTNLSIYEKKKVRADYFAENGKYVLSLRSYDALLEELPESETVLRAKIYHNKGTAYARIFRFAEAAESFKLAFDCDGTEESYIGYLASSRMRMSETEYVDFIARSTQDYEISLKVEKQFEKINRQFDDTDESRVLAGLRVYKEEKDMVSYCTQIESIVGTLKERYREDVLE